MSTGLSELKSHKKPPGNHITELFFFNELARTAGQGVADTWISQQRRDDSRHRPVTSLRCQSARGSSLQQGSFCSSCSSRSPRISDASQDSACTDASAALKASNEEKRERDRIAWTKACSHEHNVPYGLLFTDAAYMVVDSCGLPSSMVP